MISTHILDTSKGTPASGVWVTLQKQEGEDWNDVGKGKTNNDGRHAFECEAKAGMYQILFEVNTPFFKTIPVVFKVEDTKRKYHIPLLLSPFGYSTYRGS